MLTCTQFNNVAAKISSSSTYRASSFSASNVNHSNPTEKVEKNGTVDETADDSFAKELWRNHQIRQLVLKSLGLCSESKTSVVTVTEDDGVRIEVYESETQSVGVKSDEYSLSMKGEQSLQNNTYSKDGLMDDWHHLVEVVDADETVEMVQGEMRVERVEVADSRQLKQQIEVQENICKTIKNSFQNHALKVQRYKSELAHFYQRAISLWDKYSSYEQVSEFPEVKEFRELIAQSDQQRMKLEKELALGYAKLGYLRQQLKN